MFFSITRKTIFFLSSVALARLFTFLWRRYIYIPDSDVIYIDAKFKIKRQRTQTLPLKTIPHSLSNLFAFLLFFLQTSIGKIKGKIRFVVPIRQPVANKQCEWDFSWKLCMVTYAVQVWVGSNEDRSSQEYLMSSWIFSLFFFFWTDSDDALGRILEVDFGLNRQCL